MDIDRKNEKHSGGAILTLSLNAEVSQYVATMTPTSLLKYAPLSINNIAGSSENLTYKSLNKTVMAGGALSGNIMLGVAPPHGQRLPYLLVFRSEKNGDYAYDLYALSSLALGACVVQCRHLASDLRSGHSRYLPGAQYRAGRDTMPSNVPVEISSMTSPTYSSNFGQYLSSAIDTAVSKLS